MQIDERAPFAVSVCAVLILILLFCRTAEADNDFNVLSEMFSYSGFGTIGVARSDTNRAEYVTGNQMAGATENFDYKTDSKLGLQGTFAPTRWLSGTVQALAEVRNSPDFTTQIEWAYLKVQPIDNLSIRYGKLVLPLFLVSDSRNVGYSTTWLRAPDAVYGEAVFDTYEGADIAYVQKMGKYSVTAHALLGAPNPVAQLAGPGFAQIFTGHHMHGYDVTADLNTVTVRASILELDYGTYTGSTLNQEGKYHFYSYGIAYDRNDIIAQTEFIELRTGDPTDAINGWYVMGGYRLGKVVPYLIYANSHQNRAADGAVPEINGPTESVGVRLDLFRSVDFKAQFDHAKAFDYGTPFINIQPGFSNKANIFSLVADFVFYTAR
jgi:hypothetical protein